MLLSKELEGMRHRQMIVRTTSPSLSAKKMTSCLLFWVPNIRPMLLLLLFASCKPTFTLNRFFFEKRGPRETHLTDIQPTTFASPLHSTIYCLCNRIVFGLQQQKTMKRGKATTYNSNVMVKIKKHGLLKKNVGSVNLTEQWKYSST